MFVRKTFAVFVIILLFAGAAFAFPYDPNPSTIQTTSPALFTGDWSNPLGSLNVDALRILQFMINEFNTTGAGPGGQRI
jgi:hypothetical protein